MEKRYKEIDGVRYQVIQNTILGSNVVPVGESLPEVTVSDSGKVLGVNSSGEWVPVDAPSDLPDITGNAGKVLKVDADAEGVEWAEAGGGGGGDFLITFTPTDGTFPSFVSGTVDKTWAEIQSAYEAGQKIALTDGKYYLVNYDIYIDEEEPEEGSIVFIALRATANNGRRTWYISQYGVFGDGSAQIESEGIYPSFSGNSGKVLAVNSNATGVEWTTPS